MRIQFPCFVADHGDVQSVPDLDLRNKIDHLGVRFRLREHEAAKLSLCKRSFFVEDHPAQIFFERELPLFVGVECQVMPVLHLRELHMKSGRRTFAGIMIPAV